MFRATRQYSQQLQSSLVRSRCLISRYRVAYKRDCSEVVVCAMIVALIERDNNDGLSNIDNRHALAFNKIARQAWHTSIKAINNHRDKLRESVLQIFDAPRKITDVVARKFGTKVRQTFIFEKVRHNVPDGPSSNFRHSI